MPRLDIPHRMQRGSGYCLPACIEMALAYIGIQRDQNDLARQIGVIGNVGVAISRVMRVAGSNIQVFWKSGEESDLLQALAQNVPPIVAVDTRQLPYWTEATTHVVLLAGVEDDIGGDPLKRVATVHDPAFPKPISVTMGDLMLAWDDMENYFAMIQQK